MNNWERAISIVENNDIMQTTPERDPMVCAIFKALDEAEERGYKLAKAEMVRKLDEFNPTYVEGGRVPEDAIEHRNQPRRTDGPSV